MILLRNDRTTEVMAVRTVRVVGIIEIERIFSRMVLAHVYISSASIRGVAAGLIGERDKKLVRIVPEHLVNVKLQILSVDLKLKSPILLGRSGLAASCLDSDTLRISILQQLNMKNQVEVWRIVIEPLEGRLLHARQRRLGSRLEEVVLLLPETYEVVDIDRLLMGIELHMLEVPGTGSEDKRQEEERRAKGITYRFRG